MQKEAELVCLEAIAGCPVRVKIHKSFHPATGTVDFLVKKLGRSVLDERFAQCFQFLVNGLSQNEIHFIFITEVVNGRCAEVGIATQEDLNLRPGLSYAIEYTSENRTNSCAAKKPPTAYNLPTYEPTLPHPKPPTP